MSTICEKPKSQGDLQECHIEELLDYKEELDLIGDNPVFGKARPIPENDIIGDNIELYDCKLGSYKIEDIDELKFYLLHLWRKIRSLNYDNIEFIYSREKITIDRKQWNKITIQIG